jgi:hypothetical protein
MFIHGTPFLSVEQAWVGPDPCKTFIVMDLPARVQLRRGSLRDWLRVKASGLLHHVKISPIEGMQQTNGDMRAARIRLSSLRETVQYEMCSMVGPPATEGTLQFLELDLRNAQEYSVQLNHE